MKNRTAIITTGLVAVVLGISLLAGCGTVKGLIGGPSAGKTLNVSGETLDSTSQLFETWSRDFAVRCAPAKPTLSAQICNRSADFQQYFRPGFAAASTLWRVAAKARIVALESGDKKLEAGATAKQDVAAKLVNDLKSELLERLAGGGQ